MRDGFFHFLAKGTQWGNVLVEFDYFYYNGSNDELFLNGFLLALVILLLAVIKCIAN